MHILENYALSTASKINQPYINKKFFPIPADKYITISTSCEVINGNYDYYQDVIDFAVEELSKYGYKIIQIGNKDDQRLNKVINLQGVLNINQLAFVLNNSHLHIGNDSFMIHMCASFNIPLICLYGITSPEVTGPFWKKNNQICLTPKDINWKPSFNTQDAVKVINKIKIEDIILNINKLLFNNNINNFKTIYTGNRYGHILLESLPDQILPAELFPNILLNIRFDYINTINDKDYNGALNNLNIRPCSIITDKSINLQPFLQFKEKINIIFYDVTKEIDLNFVSNLSSMGLRYVIVFHENKGNKDDINKRKFDLIDYPINLEIISNTQESFDDIKNYTYKSTKLLFANSNVYLSKAAYLNNKPIYNLSQPWIQSLNQIDDIDTFTKEDLDYSFLFKID